MSAQANAMVPVRGWRQVPGFILIALMGMACIWIAGWKGFEHFGISALTLSIVLGMVYGNTVGIHHDVWMMPAINLARSRALRLGVAFYGVRLTFTQIQALGIAGVLIPLTVLAFILGAGVWIGTRWFGLSRAQALLISTGSAVCGAAAVLAMAPVARGSARDIAVAIATVVLFGTIGMFIYPLMFVGLEHLPGVTTETYGVFIGSTLHEVAQVVAASKSVSEAAMSFGVLSKMVRVLALAPVLLVAALMMKDASEQTIQANSDTGQKNLQSQFYRGALIAWRAIPWFAVGLLVVTAINSLGFIPQVWTPTLVNVDTWLLTCAMFAIGTQTRFNLLISAGPRPLQFAAVLFGLLILGGGMINVGLRYLLA